MDRSKYWWSVAAIAVALAGCRRAGDSPAPAAPTPLPVSMPAAASSQSASRSVESFRFIGPVTTMQQVIDRVGPPDQDIGSGLEIGEYRLNDGTYVWIGSGAGRIMYVRHGAALSDSKLLYPEK